MGLNIDLSKSVGRSGINLKEAKPWKCVLYEVVRESTIKYLDRLSKIILRDWYILKWLIGRNIINYLII